MDEFILNSIYKFAIAALNGVHEKFFPLVQDISGVIGGVISIATLLYIGSKIWSSYAKNEPIEVYPLLRPFVIAFLCAHFSTCVCKPIDALIEPISSFLYERKTTELITRETVKAAIQDQSDQSKGNDDAQTDKEESFKLKKFLSHAWAWLMNKLFELIAAIMDIIIGLLQFILSFILMCSRVFFLSVLCMMGPIAFAISLFPGYQQTLTQWIAKYVSISFWLPCIYMCDIFINVLGANIINMFNTAAVAGNGDVVVSGLVLLIISILLGALSYFLYTTVPTVSSWVITGGDVHGIQGMLGTTTILSAITAIAGAKTGQSLANKNAGAAGAAKGGEMLGSAGAGIGSSVSEK